MQYENKNENEIKKTTDTEFYMTNYLLLKSQVEGLIDDKTKCVPTSNIMTENYNQYDDIKKENLLLKKEKESALLLWKTAQSTVEFLEAELAAYHSSGVFSANNFKSDINTRLKLSLEQIHEMEVLINEKNNRMHELETTLRSKEEEIRSYRERGKQLDEKVAELIYDLEKLRRDYEMERKNKEDNLISIEQYCKDLERFKKSEADARDKVNEALHLLDTALLEKENSIQKCRYTEEQLVTLRSQHEALSKDYESRLNKELDMCKMSYNEKINDMLKHIQNIDTELVSKNIIIEKLTKENRMLKASLENFTRDNGEKMKVDPRLMHAEKRLDAVFKELVLSERRNVRLLSEKKSLTMDLQSLNGSHTRALKRSEWQYKLLKDENNDLKIRIEHLQSSLKETHDMISEMQRTLLNKAQLSEKMLAAKDDEFAELNRHMKSQIEINKKWRDNYEEMTETMNGKLKLLEMENKQLKLELKHLISRS